MRPCDGACCGGGNRTLFVGDLPPQWGTPELHEFFDGFGAVEEARVIGDKVGGWAGGRAGGWGVEGVWG